MKDWSHFGAGRNPWRLTSANTLYCERANDLYVPELEFGDGVLKFEYRFRPTGAKTGYKASVSVRRTSENRGCKVALGDDCGALSASFLGGSDREKVVAMAPAAKYARPVGDWNTVEIRMSGPSIEVVINGKSAVTFDNANERGLIGLHAEGSEIEFREMYWKDTR